MVRSAKLEAAGEFLETVTYAGQRYGTLKEEVDRVLASNRHVLLDIEVNGAISEAGSSRRVPGNRHVRGPAIRHLEGRGGPRPRLEPPCAAGHRGEWCDQRSWKQPASSWKPSRTRASDTAP